MNSYEHSDREEHLKSENDFLKMKMMLEHGAKFADPHGSELPAEIENEFLNNIAAFEKQFAEQKTIKVFDKIGRPLHFAPAKDIPDNAINQAWSELRNYLNEYCIDLDVCSPNVSTRELYRFVTEELFHHETDDMDLPGWTTNFIYDEFYPDPLYDNTRIATEDCIRCILQHEPLEWTHHFRENELRLNECYPLTIEEFKFLVDKFKTGYEFLAIKDISVSACIVNAEYSSVDGLYLVDATVAGGIRQLSGKWKVILEPDEELRYWYIREITIEGIQF